MCIWIQGSSTSDHGVVLLTEYLDSTSEEKDGLTMGEGAAEPAHASRLSWRRIKRNRMLVSGGVIIVMVIALAVFGPMLARHSPIDMDFVSILSRPSATHLFGTDDFGRDVFSRVVWGSRLSLKIGLGVMGTTFVFGTAIGLAAGFYGGIVDNVLMRLCDALMAFPSMLLALAIMAALGPSALNVVIALSIVYTPRSARVVRSAALVCKEQEFVEAAEASGATPARIMWKHLFPNTISSLVVQQTFIFANAVLAEATLSFIGLGAPPPAPSWGNILGDARVLIKEAPWMTFFPGLFIVITVLGLNLMGDGLRDQLDPRTVVPTGKGK